MYCLNRRRSSTRSRR